MPRTRRVAPLQEESSPSLSRGGTDRSWQVAVACRALSLICSLCFLWYYPTRTTTLHISFSWALCLCWRFSNKLRAWMRLPLAASDFAHSYLTQEDLHNNFVSVRIDAHNNLYSPGQITLAAMYQLNRQASVIWGVPFFTEWLSPYYYRLCAFLGIVKAAGSVFLVSGALCNDTPHRGILHRQVLTEIAVPLGELALLFGYLGAIGEITSTFWYPLTLLAVALGATSAIGFAGLRHFNPWCLARNRMSVLEAAGGFALTFVLSAGLSAWAWWQLGASWKQGALRLLGRVVLDGHSYSAVLLCLWLVPVPAVALQRRWAVDSVVMHAKAAADRGLHLWLALTSPLYARLRRHPQALVMMDRVDEQAEKLRPTPRSAGAGPPSVPPWSDVDARRKRALAFFCGALATLLLTAAQLALAARRGEVWALALKWPERLVGLLGLSLSSWVGASFKILGEQGLLDCKVVDFLTPVALLALAWMMPFAYYTCISACASSFLPYLAFWPSVFHARMAAADRDVWMATRRGGQDSPTRTLYPLLEPLAEVTSLRRLAEACRTLVQSGRVLHAEEVVSVLLGDGHMGRKGLKRGLSIPFPISIERSCPH